ncbi:MAG: SPOR domain-containing protein [Desulfobacteraceae bacterium]|nr:SPOR domain-containing protein [Desulfobacteraceae bacterium]
MQKKIFLQKNLQTGGRSHVKWLMWAAVALIVLVLVTPLLVRHKSPRDMTKKPAAEKGKVVKEIPRAPAETAEGQPAGTAMETPAGVNPADAPRAADLKQPSPAGADVRPANPPDGGSELLTGDPRKAPQWAEAQRKEAPAPAAAPPTAGMPAAVQQPTRKDIRPEAKPADVSGKPKPAPGAVKPAPAGVKTASLPPGVAKDPAKEQGRPASTAPGAAKEQNIPPELMKHSASGKQMYCVQVGSFKDRKNADEMKGALARRGYTVTVSPSVHPKLGQLYVVTLKPVDNMGTASTQVEQIKHEEKVKPIILKIPPGQ